MGPSVDSTSYFRIRIKTNIQDKREGGRGGRRPGVFRAPSPSFQLPVFIGRGKILETCFQDIIIGINTPSQLFSPLRRAVATWQTKHHRLGSKPLRSVLARLVFLQFCLFDSFSILTALKVKRFLQCLSLTVALQSPTMCSSSR